MRIATISAALLLAALAGTASASTVGIEWEFSGNVKVIGDNAVDAETLSPRTIMCSSARAADGWPLVSITYDLPNHQHQRELEIVTGPIDYADRHAWQDVMAYTTGFFAAVKSLCAASAPPLPTIATRDNTVDGPPPPPPVQLGASCYVSVEKLVAEMNGAKLESVVNVARSPEKAYDPEAYPCGLTSGEKETLASRAKYKKPAWPVTVGIVTTVKHRISHSRITPFSDMTLDEHFNFARINTQVNVAVKLGDVADRHRFGPLMEAGLSAALPSYLRAVEAFAKIPDDEARGFLTMLAYAAGVDAANDVEDSRLQAKQRSLSGHQKKNNFVMLPKTPWNQLLGALGGRLTGLDAWRRFGDLGHELCVADDPEVKVACAAKLREYAEALARGEHPLRAGKPLPMVATTPPRVLFESRLADAELNRAAKPVFREGALQMNDYGAFDRIVGALWPIAP